MTHTILWNLPLIITGLSAVVMVLTAFTKNTKTFLIAVALLLSNASLNPVNEFTSRLGFGASWILIALTGWALIHHFNLNVGEILFGIPNFTDLILFSFAAFLFLSPPFIAYDFTASLRRATSFLLVFMVGWRTFGAIFRSRPNEIRSYIHIILYTSSGWMVLFVMIFLIVIGPGALQPVQGWINFALGGTVVTRLEYRPVLPGTAVSSAAATGLFLAYHWFQRFRDRRRIVIIALTPIITLIMLWGGGRTAMISMWITALILFIMELLARGKRGQVKIILTLGVIGLIPLLLWPLIEPIFMRDQGMSSIIEGLMINRINASVDIFRYFQSQAIWGAGAGALTVYASETSTPLLESFFFQAVIEYGILFGSLFILAWVLITITIMRVDFLYLKNREPAAWLPSSGVLFIWAGVFANYGFGIFSSNLALTLSVGSAAMVELTRLLKTRTTNPAAIDNPKPAKII